MCQCETLKSNYIKAYLYYPNERLFIIRQCFTANGSPRLPRLELYGLLNNRQSTDLGIILQLLFGVLAAFRK